MLFYAVTTCIVSYYCILFCFHVNRSVYTPPLTFHLQETLSAALSQPSFLLSLKCYVTLIDYTDWFVFFLSPSSTATALISSYPFSLSPSPSLPPLSLPLPPPPSPLETAPELDHVTAYIGCLSSDRIDGLYTTVGTYCTVRTALNVLSTLLCTYYIVRTALYVLYCTYCSVRTIQSALLCSYGQQHCGARSSLILL